MAQAEEIQLLPEQARALARAEEAATNALAELGRLQLEYDSAEAVLHSLEAQRAAAKARALLAVRQRDDVHAAILPDLPEGEWTFLKENGKLVRRTHP